jgi:uncharacterized protein YbaR (Trm112 family)
MIASDLLQILCCPETHQSVRLAGPKLVEAINQQIRSGVLQHRGGRVVTEKLEGGIVRADGKVLYPIRGGIPILLVDEGMSLEHLSGRLTP